MITILLNHAFITCFKFVSLQREYQASKYKASNQKMQYVIRKYNQSKIWTPNHLQRPIKRFKL